MNRRVISIGLIVLGLALVFVSVLITANNREEQDFPAIRLPEQLAGIFRYSMVTGPQALDEISFMHGKEFELISGARGTYGQRGEITVWVSSASSENAANELVEEMTEKIAEGNSPFIPTGEDLLGGRIIHRLEGLGQVHFYFQSGNLVIWFGVDSELADQALVQVLDYYP
ncbi:MAG: hypothetical protein E3J88_01290 [Anaerolineales bacterium]|nr:MAG: hypothetical protein E3J88_01290 [Anaerolineales bacterium]